MAIRLVTIAYEKDVEPSLQRILLALCDNANDHGECFPSLDFIAWKLGVSERTVRRGIDALVAKGAVSKRRRFGTSSVYTLKLDALPAKLPFEEWVSQGKPSPVKMSASSPVKMSASSPVKMSASSPVKMSASSPVKMSGRSGHPCPDVPVTAVSGEPLVNRQRTVRGTNVPASPPPDPEPPSSPSVNAPVVSPPPTPSLPLPESVPDMQSRTPTLIPARGGRTDGQVYAMVDAYAKAKGMKPADVSGKNRKQAYNAFKSLPSWVGPAEVGACTLYFLADPFYRAPGKLTVQKVADTLPEWNAAGRPSSIVTTAANALRAGARVSPESRALRAARIAQQYKEQGL